MQIQELYFTAERSEKKTLTGQDPMLGFIAVVAVCLMSGFASTYFEKVLKSSPNVSVWMQNVRLALLSIPIALITMQFKDGNVIREHGIFFAYDELVWIIVIGNALGGLLIAVCIRYTDNILKGLSQSVAVICACFGSIIFLDFILTKLIMVGISLVVISVYIYSRFPP